MGYNNSVYFHNIYYNTVIAVSCISQTCRAWRYADLQVYYLKLQMLLR